MGRPSRSLRSRENTTLCAFRGDHGAACARYGLGSPPDVGSEAHPRSRYHCVDSVSWVAPVTHRDQGETEKPAGLSLSLLTRGTPRELSVPGLTHRVRTQHSAPAACWLDPLRGSRPRQLSPLPGSENVWMGRHRANQNRQVHGHPPFTSSARLPTNPSRSERRVQHQP